MKKIWVWLVLLGIIAGGAVWWKSQHAQATVQSQEVLRSAEVRRGVLDITVSASGNVAVREQTPLRFGTSGTVAKVYVHEGQHVSSEAPLARLDTASLELAVKQARLSLEQTQLNLDKLTRPATEDDLDLARVSEQDAAQALEAARLNKQATQADANAMRLQAQRARERAYAAYQRAVGTPQEGDLLDAFHDAETQEVIAQANADAMEKQAEVQWLTAYQRYRQAVKSRDTLENGPDEDAIQQAQLQVDKAQLQVDQAEAQLADAVLTAPYAGVIASVNVITGVTPPLRDPAVVLVDDSALYVDATVDEMDVGQVAVGQPVSITLDAYPDMTLRGTVTRIAPASRTVGGVTSYDLRVQITDTRGAMVREGMTASITIRVAEVRDALLVPTWAVRSEASDDSVQFYCYRLVNGVPERAAVTIGRSNETETEIRSGLAEGDTVTLVLEARQPLELNLQHP